MHVGTAAYVTVLLQVKGHNRGLVSALTDAFARLRCIRLVIHTICSSPSWLRPDGPFQS